jgi:hypothetical protein
MDYYDVVSMTFRIVLVTLSIVPVVCSLSCDKRDLRMYRQTRDGDVCGAYCTLCSSVNRLIHDSDASARNEPLEIDSCSNGQDVMTVPPPAFGDEAASVLSGFTGLSEPSTAKAGADLGAETEEAVSPVPHITRNLTTRIPLAKMHGTMKR